MNFKTLVEPVLMAALPPRMGELKANSRHCLQGCAGRAAGVAAATPCRTLWQLAAFQKSSPAVTVLDPRARGNFLYVSLTAFGLEKGSRHVCTQLDFSLKPQGP